MCLCFRSYVVRSSLCSSEGEHQSLLVSAVCVPFGTVPYACRARELFVGEQMACLYITLTGKAFLRSRLGMMLLSPQATCLESISVETFRGFRSCCHWLDRSLPMKHLMLPLIRRSTDGHSGALAGLGEPLWPCCPGHLHCVHRPLEL